MAESVVLPHTYRPLGARVAAAAAVVVLVAIIAFLWAMLSDEVQAQFSLFQRVTVLAVFGAMVFVLYGVFRTAARAEDRGLTVVNGFVVRRLEWTQVVRLSFSRNGPWALLDLDDGSTVAVMAIQSADGDRASRSARELAAVIADQTRIDPDD
ncbi:MAG: PH domain-containing protein [Nocardioidaceae bacterium]|nr:PH domain-containing protein [Nocardioidaceae bacterium]